MLIDIAGIIVAFAFAVLVGYAVVTLVQVRKTLVELHSILITLNSQLPSLLNDVQVMTHNVNSLTDEARDGVSQASNFLYAVGTVGQTVGKVHGLVSGQGLISRVGRFATGIKAASAVMKKRFGKSGMIGDNPR